MRACKRFRGLFSNRGSRKRSCSFRDIRWEASANAVWCPDRSGRMPGPRHSCAAQSGGRSNGHRVRRRRHFNLSGQQIQFVNLVREIVAKIWEGHDRLRAFPAHQVSGQLAAFLEFDDRTAEPEAKERCRRTLNRNPELCNRSPDRKQIEIKSDLQDGNELVPVVAARPVRGSHQRPWWRRIVGRFVGKN